MLDFPPPEDLLVAIINIYAAGGEVPRTKNQSKYIHYITGLEIEFTDRPQILEQLLPFIKQHSNILYYSLYYSWIAHQLDIRKSLERRHN